ncbi:universal stress protein [Mesobacillus zeae]|nr:universal stress protein [Mesobacillus zeae]
MSVAFNKVIVAFDNSDESRQALRLAKEMKVAQPETQLIMAHVSEEKIVETVTEPNEAAITPPSFGAYTVDGLQVPPISLDNSVSEKSTHAKVEKSTDQAFYNARKEMDTMGMNVDYRLLDGVPPASLCKLASEEQADLIIIGQSSKTGIKKLFTGSTVQKMVENAPCHVLIAKL